MKRRSEFHLTDAEAKAVAKAHREANAPTTRMAIDAHKHNHKEKGPGGGQFTSGGGGGGGGEYEDERKEQPDHGIHPRIIAKAAEVGDSPEHRHARQAVAHHYFTSKAVSYDHRTKSMKRLNPATAEGMLDGIDMSKPVVMGPPPNIPPPREFVQWQAEGGFRGSYFSVKGAKPQDLGIYEHATAWAVEGQPVRPRQQKVYDTKNAKMDRVSYLHSTAAPTVDTWSVPSKPVAVAGGGVQWYVPVAAHPSMRIPTKMSIQPPIGNTVLKAISLTQSLLQRSNDPAMVDILKQLQGSLQGNNNTTIGRIIAYNYTPAPTQEIQDWADLVLSAWQEIKARA